MNLYMIASKPLCVSFDMMRKSLPVQNTMVCSRSLLLARCLLLLHLIRGAFGIEDIGVLLMTSKHLREFARPIMTLKAWQSLRRCVLLKLKRMGKTITYFAHAEGFNVGYSGLHPITALCKNSTARTNFDRIASTWSTIISCCSTKGFVFTEDCVIQLWLAVNKHAPLAYRAGKVKYSGKYTSMSLARSMGLLLPLVFNRQVVGYNESLHKVMRQGQSVTKNVFDHVGDMLSSTVFKLFHIESLVEFKKLWSKLRKVFPGSEASSIRVQSTASITWQTVFVHLCEVKQVIKKFGVPQVQDLIEAFFKASKSIKKSIRASHHMLMTNAYAGGSKCHAVYMVEAAARCLNVTLTIIKVPSLEQDAATMHKLLVNMAKTQLSPKLSYLCIPECKSMENTVRSLLPRCAALTKHDISTLSMDDLRGKASNIGVPKVNSLSRIDLLAQLENPSVRQIKPTLQNLYVKVREDGGNPQPLLKSGRRQSWNSLKCRRYLLCKRSLPELRSLLPQGNKRQRTDKKSIIETLLKDPCIY